MIYIQIHRYLLTFVRIQPVLLSFQHKFLLFLLYQQDIYSIYQTFREIRYKIPMIKYFCQFLILKTLVIIPMTSQHSYPALPLYWVERESLKSIKSLTLLTSFNNAASAVFINYSKLHTIVSMVITLPLLLWLKNGSHCCTCMALIVIQEQFDYHGYQT